MELSKAPRLAVTWGCGLGCVGTSALGGGAAGGRGGGGGAGGIDNAPVELREKMEFDYAEEVLPQRTAAAWLDWVSPALVTSFLQSQWSVKNRTDGKMPR